MTSQKIVVTILSVLICFFSVSQNFSECTILSGLDDEVNFPPLTNLSTFDLPQDQNCNITEGTYFHCDMIQNGGLITANLVSAEDPNSGYSLELSLSEAMFWEEWSDQDFPTGYRDDNLLAGNSYLDWIYYTVNSGSLEGWGEWEGAVLELQHAPANLFFAFQVGAFANGVNSEIGGSIWLSAHGTYFNSETSTFEEISEENSTPFSLYLDFGDCTFGELPDLSGFQDQTISNCILPDELIISGSSLTEDNDITIEQLSGCDAEISIDEDIYLSNLHIGDNEFLVTAEDVCGNIQEQSFTISVIPCLGEMVSCDPFSAGNDATVLSCLPMISLEAEISCNLIGTWSILAGNGSFSDINDPNSVFFPENLGEHVLQWSTECNEIELTDQVTITMSDYDPLLPNAGEDQEFTICDSELTINLAGNELPEPSVGFWNLVQGPPAVISDNSQNDTEITFDQGGVYTLEWGFVGLCNEVYTDQVEITIIDPLQDLLDCPFTEVYTLCEELVISLDGSALSDSDASWTQESGPDVTISDANIPNPTVEITEAGNYTFRYQFINPCKNLQFCDFNYQVSPCPECPEFSAGLDQIIPYCCTAPESIGLQGVLDGSVSSTWYVYTGGGSVLNPNESSTLVTLGPEENCYIFSAQCFGQNIQDTVCVFPVQDCPTYSAGEDQEHYLCSGEVLTELNAGPLSPESSGMWEVISNNELDIDNPNNETTSVTIYDSGTYELEWAYTDECGLDAADTILITVLPEFILDPECGTFSELDIIPDVYTLSAPEVLDPYEGEWIQTAGTPVEFADLFNASTEVTGLDFGEYTFEWTVTSEECDVIQECVFTLILEDPNIPGCTHQLALNYDPSAIVDDGSCLFDFTICDCNGNSHSPYVTLQLGDGNPNDEIPLNFNCAMWAYDCGDIDESPVDDPYDVCNGNMPPDSACPCLPSDLLFDLGEEYMEGDDCYRTLNLTPIVQGDCMVMELCFDIGTGFNCVDLSANEPYYYSGDLIEAGFTADEQDIHFYYTTPYGQSDVYTFYNPQCAIGVEETPPTEFMIFPNPSSGVFTVRLPHTGSFLKFQVFDHIGQLVYQYRPHEITPEINLDLSHLSDGIYILETQELDKSSRKQLVLTKH